MHLPLATDVAFPLIALLVAVVLVVAILVAILGLRRRHSADPTPQPTSSDWIGHHDDDSTSNNTSNSTSGTSSNEGSTSTVDEDAGALTVRRVTVAQAAAERDPDTAPLPAASTAAPAPDTTTPDTTAPDTTTPDATPATTTPALVAGSTAAAVGVGLAAQRSRPAATQPQPAATAPEPSPAAHQPAPTAAPAAPQRPATATPPLSAARPTITTTDNPDNTRNGAASPTSARTEPTGEPTSRGDVRDRLLAVLLDNPAQAVHAVTELDATRGHLDRLTEALDAIRRERGVLGDVLARLAATGLQPEQLATLAGLPLTEVHDLLPTCGPSLRPGPGWSATPGDGS